VLRAQAIATLGEQLGCEAGDEGSELALQRVDRAGQIADAAQLVACDTDTCGLLGARQTHHDHLHRPPSH